MGRYSKSVIVSDAEKTDKSLRLVIVLMKILSIHNLSDTVSQLCATILDFTTNNKIKFVFDIEPEIRVLALNYSIELILINLISNAFKNTPSNKTVTLVVITKNNTVLIKIIDSGKGLHQDKLKKILEFLSRPLDTSKDNSREIGVGLTLVKYLVKIHHWQIHVTSEAELGSEFQIQIPALIPRSASDNKSTHLPDSSQLDFGYFLEYADTDKFKSAVHSTQRQEKLLQKRLSQYHLNTSFLLSRLPSNFKLTPKNKKFISKLEIVLAQYYSDSNMNVENLARQMHISSGHLLNKLKTLIGKGPKKLLIEYRIFKAKHLLETQDLNIADIAEAVGFKNQRYFSTSFKNIVKFTPSEYRRNVSLTTSFR
ncbi:MAG: helix-turn-helix domain-containing protein [Exilibacterium sp.]